MALAASGNRRSRVFAPHAPSVPADLNDPAVRDPRPARHPCPAPAPARDPGPDLKRPRRDRRGRARYVRAGRQVRVFLCLPPFPFAPLELRCSSEVSAAPSASWCLCSSSSSGSRLRWCRVRCRSARYWSVYPRVPFWCASRMWSTSGLSVPSSMVTCVATFVPSLGPSHRPACSRYTLSVFIRLH